MKSILVVGMGEFGKHVAKQLSLRDIEVCIVDQDKDVINLLSDDFENAYIGDCMQKITLKQLGVANFDICIVCIGDNFQASLEITSNLKELGAKYIISKAHSDTQSKFLKMAGANETIYPEKEMAEKVAVKCSANNIFDYIRFSSGYSVFELTVPKTWIGENLKDLNVRSVYGINVIAINRNGSIVMPTAAFVFEKDDHVFIFGKESIIDDLQK